MFPIPIVPLHIPWLEPVSGYAPLIWLSGIVCLWLTRYTHQLAQRWGRGYYGLSAVVRPLGVLLILIGWLAVLALPGEASIQDWGGWLIFMGWDGRPTMLFWIRILSCLGALLSLGFGLWAIGVLGLRRSFLYRRLDDPLVTKGPYSVVRHPQFLSAVGITFFYVVQLLPLDPGLGHSFIPAHARRYRIGCCSPLPCGYWPCSRLESRTCSGRTCSGRTCGDLAQSGRTCSGRTCGDLAQYKTR